LWLCPEYGSENSLSLSRWKGRREFASEKEKRLLFAIKLTATLPNHMLESSSRIGTPQSFPPPQNKERATLSIEILRQLRSIGHHGWQFIITLDESRFYCSTDHGQIWLRVEEQPPERTRHAIQDPKMIMTIAWNPMGFHLLGALPKSKTFNNQYYHVHILTEFLPLRPQVNWRRPVIHTDNAKPRTARKCRAVCEENRFHLAVHPPYSHDLAATDFFLFGYIKHCVQGITFPSREELLAAIFKLVGAISRPTLEDMLRGWIERLEWVSQNNGDYCSYAKY
jgi:hypothetical protein